MTASSFARHALGATLALGALLLTQQEAAAQHPRANAARPAPPENGHGQKSEPVGFGAGFAQACGSDRVREIQRRLHGLGYRLGSVDGLYGPRTRNAVRLLQYTLGVRPTGVVSATTLTLLRERSPLQARAVHAGTGRAGTCGAARVRVVQRRLRTLGYHPGSVDGWFGPRTRAAVIRFQRDHRLQADGSIAPATILAALRRESSQRRDEPQRVRQPSAPTSRERVASAGQAEPMQVLADPSEVPAMLTGAAVALLALNALLFLLARRRPDGDAGRRPAAAPAAPPEPGLAVEANGHQGGDAPGRALVAGTPVFGYVSVGERERHVDPGTYDAQANEIRSYCNARGLELVRIVQDVEPEHGRALTRPGLRYVLEQMALGAGSGLVVTELRRLSGTAAGLAPLLQWFDEWDAALVALDLDLDTTTTAGDQTARALAQVSAMGS